MKCIIARTWVVVGLITAGLCASQPARAGGFGLGVVLGAPTGITGKILTSGKHGIDFVAAWSLAADQAFHVHADYLWASHAFNIKAQPVDVHYGVGGRLRIYNAAAADDLSVGVRVPVGLSAMLNHSPVEIFLEIGLVVDVIPRTVASGDGGLGVRYYF